MNKEKENVAFVSVLAAIVLTGSKLVIGVLTGYPTNLLIGTITTVMGRLKTFLLWSKPSFC